MKILRLIIDFFTEDPVLKGISFFVAVVIWFYSVLERPYLVEQEVPIRFHNLAKEYTIVKVSATKCKIKIFAKGRDLLRLHFRPPYINVDLSKARRGVRDFILSSENVHLSSNAEIREISPHKIHISLKELEEKRVSLDIPQKGSPKPGFSVLRIIQKDTVHIWGLREEIELISTLSTEPLLLEGLSEDREETLRVITPPDLNLTCKPGSVRVLVEIEKELERTFSKIPLIIIAEEEAKVKVNPKEATIRVKGPKSKVERIGSKDIEVILDAGGLKKGKYELLAEIKLPPGIDLVKCEPTRFSIIIE